MHVFSFAFLCIYKIDNNFRDLILSFHYAGFKNSTPVKRLWGNWLYTLSFFVSLDFTTILTQIKIKIWAKIVVSVCEFYL